MIFMKKAAMPVPYIIALIIGVVVVAVLAYWFVSSGGKGAAIGTEAECNARKVEFCATQTPDSLSKAQAVCKTGDEFFTDSTKRKEYCGRIIPDWKET